MKRVIIIQGPSSHVNEQKKSWIGYDVIWSTWVGEESKYEVNDLTIFNSLPSEPGVQNIALQQKTTLEGIKKAKELGYERVLKWRSDLIPNNPKKLLELFDDDSLNFLAWHDDAKYFVDYIIEGKINEVYDCWDIPTLYAHCSEKITTDNILNRGFKNFNFICDGLDSENEIYWSKYNVFLSTYKNEKCYIKNVNL